MYLATAPIHKIMDTVQVSGSFRKREFILEMTDNPQYPQYVSFQLVQDKVDLIDVAKKGDLVEVSFNLRGREWISPSGEVKYFNTLDAWRINVVQPQTPGQRREESATIEDAQVITEDDLPF